jgi:hypothetical protein
VAEEELVARRAAVLRGPAAAPEHLRFEVAILRGTCT